MKRIPLTQGKFAVVDDADYERVSAHNWFFLPSANGYAARFDKRDGRRHLVLLHRFLMEPAEGVQVDHIDRDGLNCQRSNMRLCTHQENMRNRGTWGRSRCKGVWFASDRQKWRAEIWLGGRKRKSLGTFDREADAAEAYDQAARELFGEFAVLNGSQ